MNGYKLIGKGSFSKVYRKDNEPIVLIKSNDWSKECMALGWFPDSPLFPIVNLLDDNTYTMKYYAKVIAPSKVLNKRSYKLYTTLRALKNSFPLGTKAIDYYQTWVELFSSLPSCFSEEIEILIDAITAMANYGSDTVFEISPRNIAADEKGNLVLLDCFFIKSQLRR